MIPNMDKIAAEQLPCVFDVAARTVATQSLNIFGAVSYTHLDLYKRQQRHTVRGQEFIGIQMHLGLVQAGGDPCIDPVSYTHLYRITARGGKGIRNYDAAKDKVAAVKIVDDVDDVLLDVYKRQL